MANRTFSLESSPAVLPRTVGVFTATCVVVANVIGVGIFTTPGFLARDLASPFAVLAIWFLGAILALSGALSYSELGATFPEAGGEYVYLREAYGPFWGYLSGWTSFFTGFTAPIAAACIGTFILAESGLLDRHDATTTWWLTPLFRQRYPAVRLDASRMIVRSGQFVTAGAALSHIDMTLWLIRQSSPELAALVANYLIVDSRPTQSAYVISDHLAHADPLVERFDHWGRAHMDQGFNLDDAARELATSKRTLARRIRAVLGKTPVTHIQDLRIERAVHLLKTSSDSVDKIAGMVCYADGVTLRTLLRRRLGKGIREIKGA